MDLAPKFSIRTIFALTAIFAVIFMLYVLAARGVVWAAGIAAGISLVAATTLVHVTFTLVAWQFSRPKETTPSPADGAAASSSSPSS